ILIRGNRYAERAIQEFMFEVKYRVRVLKRGAQEALGIGRVRRVNDFQPGRMEKPAFRTLGMKGTGRGAGTGRHADNDVRRLPPAPMDLGQVVHDLVEPLRDKVCELHFNHRLHAPDGKAQRGPHHGRFTQWRIAYALRAKLLQEAFCDFKHTTITPDILAHKHELRISFHALAQPCGMESMYRSTGYSSSPGSISSGDDGTAA